MYINVYKNILIFDYHMFYLLIIFYWSTYCIVLGNTILFNIQIYVKNIRKAGKITPVKSTCYSWKGSTTNNHL